MEFAPWFVVARNGSPLVPRAGDELTLVDAVVGNIEIPSGVLRIAPVHDFANGAPALDAILHRGRWRITRLLDVMDESAGGLGALVDILEFADGDGDSGRWLEASAGHQPFRFSTQTLLVADADSSLVLGTGPGARSFPWMPGWTGEPATPEEVERLQSWSRQSDPHASFQLLQPDSTVAAYRARPGVGLNCPWDVRLAFGKVWVKVDAEDIVIAVAIDWLPAIEGAETAPSVHNVWAERMPGTGGRLVADESLPVEHGDPGRLLDGTQQCDPRFLGELRLEGRLVAIAGRHPRFDRRADVDFATNSAELPLELNGSARVYGERDEWNGLLLRFGDTRPTRWLRLNPPDLNRNRGGDVLVSSRKVLEAAASNPAVNEGLVRMCVDARSGARMFDDEYGAVLFVSDGSEPSQWLAGLDQGGDVVALFLAQDGENTVYPFRPAGDDAP